MSFTDEVQFFAGFRWFYNKTMRDEMDLDHISGMQVLIPGEPSVLIDITIDQLVSLHINIFISPGTMVENQKS